MDFDPRDDNGRDRDDRIHDSRWGEDPCDADVRELTPDPRHGPRDTLLRASICPAVSSASRWRTTEDTYELNGDDSRMLATIDAFRQLA